MEDNSLAGVSKEALGFAIKTVQTSEEFLILLHLFWDFMASGQYCTVHPSYGVRKQPSLSAFRNSLVCPFVFVSL